MVEKQTNREYYANLQKASNAIHIICPIILISIGTVGNLFTIYVYTRKYFHRASLAFYYTCLALVDLLILYFGLIKFFLNAMNYTNLILYSEFTCKFFTTIIYILQQFSSWILVLASLDRYLLINTERYFLFTRSKKFRYYSITSIGLLLVLLNAPNMIYLTISVSNLTISNNQTSSSSIIQIKECLLKENPYFNNRTADVLDLLVFAIIPFVLMTLCTYLISKSIFDSKIKFVKTRKRLKREYQFSVTIMSVNIIFLILNLPICVLLILRNFQDDKRITFEQVVVFDFAFAITNTISYINFSSSFLIHLTMNRLFRHRFFKIFKIF
jgi:hypothetical protein